MILLTHKITHYPNIIPLYLKSFITLINTKIYKLQFSSSPIMLLKRIHMTRTFSGLHLTLSSPSHALLTCLSHPRPPSSGHHYNTCLPRLEDMASSFNIYIGIFPPRRLKNARLATITQICRRCAPVLVTSCPVNVSCAE